MPLYEQVFLARQDISTQQVEALVQSFRTILEENGGSIGKAEYWGLKSLSYRIKKNRKAHYELLNIDAPHAAVAELERQMRLSTDVIRFLTVRVDGQFSRKPLGLYLMVEPVDEKFAKERFGSAATPVFKPVTYELFRDLGDDWSAYEAIYDLKTKATPEQRRRVIEFARLVTHANETEFARRLEEFLDLERFARYLAGEVLLSNYDGFLSDAHNFYLYLDPTSNRFGFIPWDLDLSWGGFFLLGSTRDRERASIWQPWVGRHHFLERVMAVPRFRELYRARLEDLCARLFVQQRLIQRIDEAAQVVRDPIAAESEFRRSKFEDAVSSRRLTREPTKKDQGADRPSHQLKRFVEARAASVRQQLDGDATGVILSRRK